MAYYNENEVLEQSIEIAKAYAKGGANEQVAYVLESVYETLKKINEEVLNDNSENK